MLDLGVMVVRVGFDFELGVEDLRGLKRIISSSSSSSSSTLSFLLEEGGTSFVKTNFPDREWNWNGGEVAAVCMVEFEDD